MSNVYLEVQNLKEKVAGLENDLEELTGNNERLTQQISGMEKGLENDARVISELSGKIQNIRQHKKTMPVFPSNVRARIANGMVDNTINKIKEWSIKLDNVIG